MHMQITEHSGGKEGREWRERAGTVEIRQRGRGNPLSSGIRESMARSLKKEQQVVYIGYVGKVYVILFFLVRSLHVPKQIYIITSASVQLA